MNQRELVNSPVSNIPRKEVSAAPKRNKPGQESKYPKQLIQEAVPKKEVPCACTSEHGLHCNTMSAVQCTARGFHPLVDLIPSTLRRDLRSLSEIPSTLRRKLRSIAVSFFLPCEHNNRKADRIAFLNLHNKHKPLAHSKHKVNLHNKHKPLAHSKHKVNLHNKHKPLAHSKHKVNLHNKHKPLAHSKHKVNLHKLIR